MAEPSNQIDVVFVGQIGVGKSSLINMIMGRQDGDDGAAEVSHDVPPCTLHTTPYEMPSENGLRCFLWDTRGLDEAADVQDRGWMTRIMERIRQKAFKQERELKEALRERTRQAKPILMWCINAAKIDIGVHWQQFRKVYVEYCEKKAIPVIVITQMHPSAVDWVQTCHNQLQELDLGEGPLDISVLRTRKYRPGDISSPEYREDSKAIRDLISKLTKR